MSNSSILMMIQDIGKSMTIHSAIPAPTVRSRLRIHCMSLIRFMAGVFRADTKPLRISDMTAAHLNDLHAGYEIRRELARREWDRYK